MIYSTSNQRMCTMFYIAILGLVIIMAAGVAANDDDGEKPSEEVIQEIKYLLLNKIGVISPPPPMNRASLMSEQEAKAYSIRNWRRNARTHEEQFETVSSTLSAQIAHKGSILVFPFRNGHLFQQKFSIKAARLSFIPRKHLTTESGAKATVEIYRKKKVKILIDTSKAVLVNQTITIDIQKDLEAWTKSPAGIRGAYKLKLKCDSKPCLEPKSVPFIDIEYHRLRLPKKTAEAKPGSCSPNGCCRKTVKVFVKDLGWDDWFLMPKEFDYHYCSGSCSKMKDSLYSKLLKSLNASTCCAPTELTGMRALYRVGGLVYDKQLHNLSPKACACGGIAGVR